jgi:hypothetical protein
MPAANRPLRRPNRLSSRLQRHYFAFLIKKHLLSLFGLLLGAGMQASVCAQVLPIIPAIGLVNAIAAQNAANRAIAEKTTTTVAYRGQSFLMKRTPEAILTGAATDRITQLEIQLGFCHNILLTDTLNPTCPPDCEATIRATIKYIDLARPNWDQKAYRQEFKFYLAKDKRRRKVYDY